MANSNKRRALLQVINSPLGFYALALLIVETFLALVLGLAGLPQLIGPVMYLGVGMFVLVVGCVALTIWFRPENPALSEKSHQERYMAERGDSLSGPIAEGSMAAPMENQ